MVGALTSSVVGYIILMTVDVATQRGLAYFAIFLCTIGVCIAVPFYDYVQRAKHITVTGLPNERHLLSLDSVQHQQSERKSLNYGNSTFYRYALQLLAFVTLPIYHINPVIRTPC